MDRLETWVNFCSSLPMRNTPVWVLHSTSPRCVLRILMDFGSSVLQTPENPTEETLQLLSAKPDRLGHATFLNEEVKSVVEQNGMCIEICLTSNLLYVHDLHRLCFVLNLCRKMQNSEDPGGPPYSVSPGKQKSCRYLRASLSSAMVLRESNRKKKD